MEQGRRRWGRGTAATRPQNRHLKPHPEALGVVPLGRGEASRTFRVRGGEAALEWFGRLTAAQKGEEIERAMRNALKRAAGDQPGPGREREASLFDDLLAGEPPAAAD